PKSPATAPARFPNYAVARLASTVAAKAATKLLILTLAAAMLAVLLSSMTAAAMLVMLLSLSPLPLPLRSPCRCGRAHRNAARWSPVPPPPCSPCCCRCAGPRHARCAALAVTGTATLAVTLWPGAPECCPTVARAAAAMLVMLRSLCPPPPCSSCCSRCPRYRYACRDAVTGLIGMLPDVRIRRRRHAR
ncbi:hypothetical protein PR001_g32990, partial [Phytophthora rubi]